MQRQVPQLHLPAAAVRTTIQIQHHGWLRTRQVAQTLQAAHHKVGHNATQASVIVAVRRCPRQQLHRPHLCTNNRRQHFLHTCDCSCNRNVWSYKATWAMPAACVLSRAVAPAGFGCLCSGISAGQRNLGGVEGQQITFDSCRRAPRTSGHSAAATSSIPAAAAAFEGGAAGSGSACCGCAGLAAAVAAAVTASCLQWWRGVPGQ